MKSFREKTKIEKLRRKYVKKNKINVDVSDIVLEDMALEALSEANCDAGFLNLIATETKEKLLVELDDSDFEKVKAIREIGSVYDIEIKKLLKAFEILEKKQMRKSEDLRLNFRAKINALQMELKKQRNLARKRPFDWKRWKKKLVLMGELRDKLSEYQAREKEMILEIEQMKQIRDSSEKMIEKLCAKQIKMIKRLEKKEEEEILIEVEEEKVKEIPSATAKDDVDVNILSKIVRLEDYPMKDCEEMEIETNEISIENQCPKSKPTLNVLKKLVLGVEDEKNDNQGNRFQQKNKNSTLPSLSYCKVLKKLIFGIQFENLNRNIN